MNTKSDRVKILALDEYEALVRRLENAATERNALRAALEQATTDVDSLSPLEALTRLYELRTIARAALDEGGA